MDDVDCPQLCVCVCDLIAHKHIFVIVSVWSFLLRSDFRCEPEGGMCIALRRRLFNISTGYTL